MRKIQFSKSTDKLSKQSHIEYRLTIVLITLLAVYMYFYHGSIWYTVGMFAFPFVIAAIWMSQNYLSGDYANLGMD